MKFTFTLSLLCFFISSVFTQEISWVLAEGGLNSEDCKDVVVDDFGYIYCTGYFYGTVDFDPSENVFLLTSQQANETDMFVQKLDPNGNLLWCKRIGGDEDEIGRSITLDNEGNILLTGSFEGNVDFDPGPGLETLSGNIIEDIFVLKLTGDGDFLWVYGMGESNYDGGFSIEVDGVGDVYVTGFYRWTIDFDPSEDTLLLGVNDTNARMFIQKINSSGELLWVKSFGDDSSVFGSDLDIDVNNNLYITGHFYGEVDFDPNENEYFVESNGNSDVFILNLNSEGGLVWVKTFGGLNNDSGRTIEAGNNHYLFVVGNYRGSVDFDPSDNELVEQSFGESDFFISKYVISGDLVWTRTFGGSENDIVYSLTLDDSDNVISVGAFQDTLRSTFDESLNLISSGSSDVFIQKLDNNGNVLFQRGIGGIGWDQGHSIFSKDNELYITGVFSDVVFFEENIDDINSNGVSDIFLLKLSCLTTSIKESKNNFNLLVYPIPAKDNINIETPLNMVIERCKVIDGVGNLVYSEIVFDTKTSINISVFSQGVYTLIIECDNQQIFTKHIIVN